MKQEHTCFAKMLKPLSSHQSQESYSYKMQRFMGFADDKGYVDHAEDFESLLRYDSEEITDILEDYVNYLENNGILSSSISTILTPAELFFEMNRKMWHKKLVRRGIQKVDRIPGGKDPVTNDDLLLMLGYCERSLRKQAMIHFLASTGIRPGALIDPVLRLKHLEWLPNPDNPRNQPKYCYCITVYDESKEGYWAFLTPEASNILSRYITGRKHSREVISSESPIFVADGSRWNSKYGYLTDDNLQMIISKVIKGAQVPRIKQGNTYNKSVIYMFRKRFNTILKINNDVNSNIAEKLMAHKRGLDGAYLQPTRDECFKEFVKAITELTVDNSARKQAELDNVYKEKSLLNNKINQDNRILLKEIREMKDDLAKVKKRQEMAEKYEKKN